MIIAPSLLAANPSCYRTELELIQECGAKYLHIDVMDGHFVPNISFGPDIIKGLRKTSELFFDVHLMISNPEMYIQRFIDVGADSITIHCEAAHDVLRLNKYCRQRNVKFGVAINPRTPLTEIYSFRDFTDIFLIMSVQPGFGGQAFIPESISRIEQLHAMRESNGYSYLISVDGGVKESNCREIIQAGADILVAGSAVFGKKDKAEAIRSLSRSDA